MKKYNKEHTTLLENLKKISETIKKIKVSNIKIECNNKLFIIQSIYNKENIVLDIDDTCHKAWKIDKDQNIQSKNEKITNFKNKFKNIY